MELWFLLALGASFSISVAHVFDKVLTNYINPQLLPAIKKAINGTTLLIISIFFFRFYFPATLHFWIFIGILAFLDIISTVFYFTGIKKGEISKLICFDNALLVVLTFSIGVFLLSESVSLLNGVGVLLISIGTYTVLSDGKLVIPERTKALELIFVSAVLWSLYNVTVKVAVSFFPPYLLAILVYYVGDPFLWGYNFKKNREDINNLGNVFQPKLVLFLVLACFGASLASLLTFFALKFGNASLVLPVVYSSPLFTVILSGRILKEKRIALRFFGAFLIVCGVSAVYIF